MLQLPSCEAGHRSSRQRASIPKESCEDFPPEFDALSHQGGFQDSISTPALPKVGDTVTILSTANTRDACPAFIGLQLQIIVDDESLQPYLVQGCGAWLYPGDVEFATQAPQAGEVFRYEQGRAFGAALATAQDLNRSRRLFAKVGRPRHQHFRTPRVARHRTGELSPSTSVLGRHLGQAAEEFWRSPRKPVEYTKAESRFLEALVTAPDNQLAWDAVRFVGMLRMQVETLRDDVHRAPSTYAAARAQAANRAAEESAVRNTSPGLRLSEMSGSHERDASLHEEYGEESIFSTPSRD
jgi:hypothetical protein